MKQAIGTPGVRWLTAIGLVMLFALATLGGPFPARPAGAEDMKGNASAQPDQES